MDKVCSYCGSIKNVKMSKVYGDLLCDKHYMQVYNHGHLFERTYKDPNEIVLHTDYAEIVLLNNKSEETGRAFIDVEDVERISNYKFYLGSNGYPQSRIGRELKALHQILKGKSKDGFEWDHKDRNKLNNRKNNLREITHSINAFNKDLCITNKSGIRGVVFNTLKNKWQGYLTMNKRRTHLGYFIELEDAIKARKEVELKYFGFNA